MTNCLSIIDTQKLEAERSLPCLLNHIPGRVRFRVYRLKDDPNYTVKLKQFLLAQPGINNVRVNRLAASIAINYCYGGICLAEIASGLGNLIEQAATTKSVLDKQTQEQSSERENWSSLTLPILTTSFANGSDIAREIADVVLMNDDLAWLKP